MARAVVPAASQWARPPPQAAAAAAAAATAGVGAADMAGVAAAVAGAAAGDAAARLIGKHCGNHCCACDHDGTKRLHEQMCLSAGEHLGICSTKAYMCLWLRCQPACSLVACNIVAVLV